MSIENEKNPKPKKRKTGMSIFALHNYVIFLHLSTRRSKCKKTFNLSWLRVQISYHKFNNLYELLNRDLAAKTRRGIISIDLMYRSCNCSLPSKVIDECVYEGKYLGKGLIYEVKCSMCEAIYIGKIQNTLQKRKENHFSDLLQLLKMDKKSD